MFDSIRKRISHQTRVMGICFAQTDGLPFSEVISAETIRNIMNNEVSSYRYRIFPTIVTLRAFLSQVLEYRIIPAKMQ